MQALKLRVDVDEQSNVRISRIFDADITEALPMSEAPTANVGQGYLQMSEAKLGIWTHTSVIAPP